MSIGTKIRALMEGTTDAQDVGAAPAVESGDYPGCYYRTVDGVVEWVNPPLIEGVEYRTTERYKGKPVYVKLVNCGVVTAGRNHIENFPIPGLMIRYAGQYAAVPLPFFPHGIAGDTTAITVSMDYGDAYIVTPSTYSDTENEIFIQVWYTR